MRGVTGAARRSDYSALCIRSGAASASCLGAAFASLASEETRRASPSHALRPIDSINDALTSVWGGSGERAARERGHEAGGLVHHVENI